MEDAIHFNGLFIFLSILILLSCAFCLFIFVIFKNKKRAILKQSNIKNDGAIWILIMLIGGMVYCLYKIAEYSS